MNQALCAYTSLLGVSILAWLALAAAETWGWMQLLRG